jgi:hypothetical protein
VQAFKVLFPYATKDQVRRALESLESSGAIQTGTYNSNPYDRTKWYTCQFELANLPNDIGNNAKSLTNTDINTDTSNALSSGDDETQPKGEKQTSKKLSASECQQIAELYNKALGGSLPRVTTVTPARQSAINARYRELLNSTNDKGQIRFTDKEGGMKWFGVFFGKVAAAPFLIGDNDRGWKANFDWVLAPKNFLKIVEGGFDQ